MSIIDQINRFNPMLVAMNALAYKPKSPGTAPNPYTLYQNPKQYPFAASPILPSMPTLYQTKPMMPMMQPLTKAQALQNQKIPPAQPFQLNLNQFGSPYNLRNWQ